MSFGVQLMSYSFAFLHILPRCLNDGVKWVTREGEMCHFLRLVCFGVICIRTVYLYDMSVHKHQDNPNAVAVTCAFYFRVSETLHMPCVCSCCQ